MDAHGQGTALTVYFEEGAGTREARRIAPYIAKLPELLSKPQTSIDPLPP
jgi:hypothetical protein